MINEERVIIKGNINIGATIAYKDKSEKRPLVLLIMGNGSLDRDGNSFGFKSKLYKDMSDMFVDMGYVCIRYDKRGTHESKASGINYGLSDLVDDAASIIHYAKKLDNVDEEKIVVCGHSEGAMIATLLTKNEDLAKSSIRISLSHLTSEEDVLNFVKVFKEEVNKLRSIRG